MVKELIDSAIVTHGHWKIELREAIEKGASIHTVETIKKDNACAVGQWLYALPVEDRTAVHAKVKELHAAFHQCAADVLALALEGHKQEAQKSMDRGGAYYQASAELVRNMLEWKKSIA